MPIMRSVRRAERHRPARLVVNIGVVRVGSKVHIHITVRCEEPRFRHGDVRIARDHRDRKGFPSDNVDQRRSAGGNAVFHRAGVGPS